MRFFTFDKFSFYLNENFGIVAMHMLVFSMMMFCTTFMNMNYHT